MKNYLLLSYFLLFSVLNYAQDKPQLTLGGALRFNYNLSTWKKQQVERGGDFGFDVFRINARAQYKGIKLNAEYRQYSKDFGGGMLKQGWVGYDFNTKDNLQLGLTQVPFGITQYNSHSWFFSINYYWGLEDDHDMGVKFTHTGKDFDYSLAFFKNAEELRFGNRSDASDSRYSYDIGSKDADGDGVLNFRNKEVNQINGQLVYKISGEESQHRIGVSAQYGGVQNLDTDEMGKRYAFAGHYEMNVGKMNLKSQATYQKIAAKNLLGESSEIVAMTAYGYPYFVAAEVATYTLGASYNIPVDWKPVSNLQVYNDFGFVDKIQNDFKDTWMNVTGVMITAGQVYTYVDFAAGKHMAWLNSDFNNALAAGSETEDGWEMRFNINIGYYF